MDPVRTDILVSAGRFIHLYASLFYRAFYTILNVLGGRLGYALQEEKAKDFIFSFHDTAGFFTLGPFAINAGTKLVNIQSNSNAFQEPENNGFDKTR